MVVWNSCGVVTRNLRVSGPSCQFARLAQKIVDNCGRTTCSCWNCEHAVHCTKEYFCGSCKRIQPVPQEKNLFEYIGLPISFKVDEAMLKQNFRQLQAQVHPDKFAQASSEEKSISDEHSRMLNEAYKTIAEPMRRAKYLIKLLAKQENLKGDLDEEALMEMMERNEKVAELNKPDELEEEKQHLKTEIDAAYAALGEYFATKDVSSASATITRLSYLHSLKNTIDKKLGHS